MLQPPRESGVLQPHWSQACHPISHALRAWKLVTHRDGSLAVAACVIPQGALVETGDSREFTWYHSDKLEVLACGRWDESCGGMTRFAAEAPEPYYTAAGEPGRVTYYPGQVTECCDGLWSYAAPWQTYWPFSAHRGPDMRKALDAGEYGGIIRFEGY
jgi:hypothetical protein